MHSSIILGDKIITRPINNLKQLLKDCFLEQKLKLRQRAIACHILILNASSSIKPKEIINSTFIIERKKDAQNDYENYSEQAKIQHDHSDIFHILNNTTFLSEYCEEVTIYIAWFIVSYLKRIICDICVQSLTDNSKSIGHFIHLKNRGI